MLRGTVGTIAAVGMSMTYAYYAAGKYDEALITVVIAIVFSVILTLIATLFTKRAEHASPPEIDNPSEELNSIEQEKTYPNKNQPSQGGLVKEPKASELESQVFGIKTVHLPYLLSGVILGFVLGLVVVTFSEPTNPQDCMLKNISKASSDNAAQVILRACNGKSYD